MKSETVFKNQIRKYWLYWCAAIMLSFLMCFTFLTDYGRAQIIVFLGYSIGSFIWIMTVDLWEWGKFKDYLNMNHYDKWEYLGGSGANNFRAADFLFGSEYFGDEYVRYNKEFLFNLLALKLTVIISVPIFLVLLYFITD